MGDILIWILQWVILVDGLICLAFILRQACGGKNG